MFICESVNSAFDELSETIQLCLSASSMNIYQENKQKGAEKLFLYIKMREN